MILKPHLNSCRAIQDGDAPDRVMESGMAQFGKARYPFLKLCSPVVSNAREHEEGPRLLPCSPSQLGTHAFTDHRQVAANGIPVHIGMGLTRPARAQSAVFQI